MKSIMKTAVAAAIVGAAALPLQSANAWWGGPGGSGYGGGPWSGMTDMFGDVDANFSSRGWGRGSGYGYPNYGYGYGGYGYPGGWGGYPGGWGGYPGGWGGYPGAYGAPPVIAVPQQAPSQ